MILHYLTIASRNMWKYKLQSLVGIIGLAVGFTFFGLGYNWMKYETSYDSFYPDSKHIYRIYGVDGQSGRILEQLPLILMEKLQQEFPEVVKVTAIYPRYGSRMTSEDRIIGDVNFTCVDEFFLELFSPKIICGKTDQLLHTAEEIVVTGTFARKYWGSPEEAIGKTLSDRYNYTMRIVSVMENPPENSNFQPEAYRVDTQARSFEQQMTPDKRWALMRGQIFVLLNEKVNVSTFRRKIGNYAIDNQFNESLALRVIPVAEMRHTLSADTSSFNITYIRTFAGAGLLLLLCSIFNFLNLYVNRMLQRIREVKLRKTVGANNFSIIRQLQIELTLHLALVFIVSVLILKSTIPIFEQRFETQIILPDLWRRFALISITGFVITYAVCLLAEIRFTRFSSLTQTLSKYNNRLFRNTSICIQLSICIFFLTSASVFYRQVSFMNHFDWGFNKEGLIKITMTHRDRAVIVDHIRQLALVQEFIPTGLFSIKSESRIMQGEINWIDKPAGLSPVIEIESVGKNFIQGFGIPLLKGRFFEVEDILSEENVRGLELVLLQSDKVVINQEMEKLIGKTNIIGTKIDIPAGYINSDGTIGMKTVEVIGVIKVFHTLTLQKPVYPLILQLANREDNGYYNYARIAKGTENQAIAAINEVFKKCAVPGDPEETEIISIPRLLDDFNKSENASLQLFAVLATLCILISVFGIFSISASNMERRKKEIAIRKVSGATATDIVLMFFSEYSKILLLANVITLPPALYFMHQWLVQYANHTEIHIAMVVSVVVFTFTMVITTVIAQVLEAANRNPVEAISKV